MKKQRFLRKVLSRLEGKFSWADAKWAPYLLTPELPFWSAMSCIIITRIMCICFMPCFRTQLQIRNQLNLWTSWTGIDDAHHQKIWRVQVNRFNKHQVVEEQRNNFKSETKNILSNPHGQLGTIYQASSKCLKDVDIKSCYWGSTPWFNHGACELNWLASILWW